MIRVFIADDQIFIRRLVAHIIMESGDMVVAGEACTGLDLVEKLPTADSDIVVMDLMMPGLAWSDTLARVRARFPRLPVLVLSSLPSELYGSSVRAAGATDYLDKVRVADELIPRLRVLADSFRPYRHRPVAELSAVSSQARGSDDRSEFGASSGPLD